MIFIDEMKNLKIYKRQFFLPYNDKDKKHRSLIYLLTPNYLSSKNLMSSPLTINRKYFESYYMERNVSYYINSKASKQAIEEYTNMINNTMQNNYTSIHDCFAEYCVSNSDKILESSEDIVWCDSIQSALKYNFCENGEYNVYTHCVDSNNPDYIGKINVEILEFTDYKAKYEWVDKIDIIDEGSYKKDSISEKEIKDIIKIKKSLSDDDKKALNMSGSDYTTTGSKCFIEYKDDEPIAYCIVDIDNNNDADLSVVCDSKYRGNGYALKVLKKGIAYAKSNCNNIYYATKAYNKASQNLAIAAGLTNVVRDDNKWKTYTLSEAAEENINITRRWGCYTKENGYNAICNVAGYAKPFRERASMIVFKDGKVYGKISSNGEFSMPGGGLNPNEKPIDAAVRETKEEARILTKNVKFVGIRLEYYDEVRQWVKDNVEDPDNWWYGYSYIYTADYDGEYKGEIADIDKDDMIDKGKWWDIDEALKHPMIKEYKEALKAKKRVLSEAGETPEITIPEVPDPGKDLKNFVRTLKMRTKKGAYQLADHMRELQRSLPTPDSITSDIQSAASSSGSSNNNDNEESENEAFVLSAPDNTDDLFIMESTVIPLTEDTSSNDMKLKQAIYAERMRTSKEQMLLLKKVKEENKFIKYAFPNNFDRYQNRNVFYDLSYYIEVYFRNAQAYKLQKGVLLLQDFMTRLFNKKNIPSSYNKRTVFVPILDWSTPGTKTWLFRESINPISVIFNAINTNNIEVMKKMFGKMDIIFFGNGCYFKLNFNELSVNDEKLLKSRFKIFIQKILTNAPFNEDEEDDQPDVESTKVIVTNITDKIEQNRGIKMSTQSELIGKTNQKNIVAFAATGVPVVKEKDSYSVKEKNNSVDAYNNGTVKKKAEEQVEKTTAKSTTKTAKEVKQKDIESVEAKKAKVIGAVTNVAVTSKNTEEAINTMEEDDDLEFKKLIMDLEAEDENTDKASKARSARMMQLNKRFEEKEIQGIKVKDLINNTGEVNPPLPATNIPVDSPFKDQWSEMKFMNFDKTYNINKDIAKMITALETKQYPIAMRDIKIEDASTSEDYIDTYTIQMEDSRGKRFTIKLDIPKFKDGKYLILRGNKKTIQNQYFNMPILKTEADTVQIISNYSKIFIRRFGNTTGKTISYCDRLLKALKKYSGKNIKFTYGDNSKLSDSFEAPIDYIDIGSVYSKIEYNGTILYFNQDEYKALHKEKMINPDVFYYGELSNKDLISYDSSMGTISQDIARILSGDPEFKELYENVSVAKKHVYSKASIMSAEIPLIIVASLNEGLTTVLKKANINYELKEKLSVQDRRDIGLDWIKFSDGYLVYQDNYSSSLLLNGLKEIDPEQYSIDNINSKRMWIETLDSFGGRIKADGLENFYECMLDPITLEVLEHYHLPTDYVSLLIYGNNLLADNKYISHGDSSSRRIRRNEVIAVKVYKSLFNEAYAQYANMMRHNKNNAEYSVKQSAVIDKFMTDPTSSDLSIINCLNDVEALNAVSTKGESGMNSERAYTLGKRTYDDSMLNILGLSTGFANNVGVTRQATLNANIDTERGYVKSINGDLSQMSTAKSLTATEALNPMGSTRETITVISAYPVMGVFSSVNCR